MESKRKRTISIIASDTDIGLLYDAILRSKGYVPQLSTYEGEIFQVILDFLPQLVVLHLDMRFLASIFEFLVRIRQTYDEDKHLAILLVGQKDWFDPRLESLVDVCMTSPVDPPSFLQIVEDLLQKKLP